MKCLYSFPVTMFFILILCNLSTAQTAKTDIFDEQSDVGKVLHQGSSAYSPERQMYVLTGSGANIWGTHDEFFYKWKKLKGNFILTAHVNFTGTGKEAHRKIGWMIRSSLDTGSAHASAVVHGDGLTSFQFRKTSGAPTEEMKSDIKAADVIELERNGNKIMMRVARQGDDYTTSEIELPLGEEVYAGLFICSHNQDVTERAEFKNVRIVVPAKETLVPYRDYLGSLIETVEIENGNRKSLYYSPKSLQAPNWTKDGKYLIYNSEGLIYQLDLAKNEPTPVNTDFAKSNNNDHAISFDGNNLALSNGTKTDKGNVSIVYVVPIKGGKPRRITEEGPSYLHGWSPDGKWLVYCADRNNEYDVYKISSKGGKEMRLTDAKGLDDGPEYSPDGKYIYFNSNRTGTMQLWRMKPDGSNQEQLTNDDYNNWFPHVSPNGKWIAFISFQKDVSPGDHPFYKHVSIRLMPVSGGKPKVLVYLYGGQGTINTPSWSPDSKKIAFVSNTDHY